MSTGKPGDVGKLINRFNNFGSTFEQTNNNDFKPGRRTASTKKFNSSKTDKTDSPSDLGSPLNVTSSASRKPNSGNNLFKPMKESPKKQIIKVSEEEEVVKLLRKYDVVLSGHDDENIPIYETYFDQLNEEVIKKKDEIKKIEKGYVNQETLQKINQKKDNINKLIDCVNRINQRIKDAKIIIFNKEMKELNNSHVERYVVKNDYLIGKEMDKIMNSIQILSGWSEKQNYSIIFDSIIDGNGSNNTFYDKVFGKSNLYFISIDDYSNIYGGYLPSQINKTNEYITDKNAFIFSLYRIGMSTKKKYLIQSERTQNAFRLYFNDKENVLYQFGLDVVVREIGNNSSYCDSYYYNTSSKHNELVVDHVPYFFSIKE